MFYAAQLEVIADEAVAHIAEGILGASPETVARLHAVTVREAQSRLNKLTPSSVAAQQLHNRINALMVERGLATWNGTALTAA